MEWNGMWLEVGQTLEGLHIEIDTQWNIIRDILNIVYITKELQLMLKNS